jgi:hypothetical protein
VEKRSGKFYECPKCNQEEYQKFIEERKLIKQGVIKPIMENGIEKQYKKVYRPAAQRTLLFDLPENLLINVQRYTCKFKDVGKQHTLLKFEKEIYLDENMIHKVNSDNKYGVN